MKPGRFFLFSILVFCFCGSLGTYVAAQGSYRAQLRGTVSDASGAVVHNATVTITDTGTNISSVAHTDDKGEYFFTGLRPSTYSVKAELKGFRTTERTGVVLAVDQEASLNFTLTPAGVSESVIVTTTAPLLDTDNATLGTDITHEYMNEIPLMGRDYFGLTFLAAGVTEAAGSGTGDNYPEGTNFTSNGQRNATAEIRLDGALISAPEQGEGGNSNVYYEPLVDSVQEFKVQNNSFSAEFGNNGGTVVNMVLKGGTNAFHGTGWYFLQRPQMDARDFFNPKYFLGDSTPNPKPDSKRDQGGFSLGGPIVKNKTFFFVDFEKVRSLSAQSGVVTVPTMAERQGDFSGLSNNIYDPNVNCTGDPTNIVRPQVGFDCNNNPIPGESPNVIPAGEIDPIGLAVLNLYPKPSNSNEFNNYNYTTLANGPDYQFDIKLDHQINDKNRISGRYSREWSNYTTPLTLGDGFDNDGIASGVTVAQNGSFEYSWTVNPRIIWTSHAAIDRVHELSLPGIPTISGFNASLPGGTQGLSPVFQQANGIDEMPTFMMQGNLPWTDLYDQCCIYTKFGHTLVSYSSQLVISRGSHLIKIGGEQRIFYNNFWQPNNPAGLLTFTDEVTSPTPFSDYDAATGLITTGNPLASLAFGYGDNLNASSQVIVTPSVADRSLETGFYIQDDWKVNSKLTVNLGLRYEWSSPYTSRNNQLEFSNFTADSGVAINFASLPATAPGGTLSAQGTMQSYPRAESSDDAGVVRHDPVRHFEHEDGSDVPQGHWAEAGLRLCVRFEDRGAGWSGRLFWNEPRHKLPVSGLRVPQDGQRVFYQQRFCHSIGDSGKPVSHRLYRSAGHAVWPACELGLSKPERSGQYCGAGRRHLPVELGNAARAAQRDRARRRLRCQSEHPSTLVWHKQPGLHPIVFTGTDFAGCALQQ